MEYIFKRSDLILEYPAKRLILNPNQDVELKSVQFSQPFILSEGKFKWFSNLSQRRLSTYFRTWRQRPRSGLKIARSINEFD